MERVAMGLKRSPIPLTKWFDAIRKAQRGILLSSQLSRPMFVGLEMKTGIAGDTGLAKGQSG